jgi:hypothetical protein
MRREMASMDLGHCFSNEIVGQGHKIIVNNLSKDGNYDIALFEKAGFRSLIAVPIMTYRIHGIMGVAYRVRKRFNRDFPELLTVIANLIGMSLNKSMLHKRTIEKEKQSGTGNPPPLESSMKNSDTQSVPIESEKAGDNSPVPQSETKQTSEEFQDHIHRMRTFKRSHKT